MVTENEQWPPLPYEEWKDTYATLHMWTQIVGKVALAQAPPLNHSWSIALLVTPRGLVTHTLPHGDRTFTMEFDFIDHQLVIRTSEGDVGSVALAPRSVASFYAEVMATLTSMRLPVKIWPMAVEIPVPIRLDTDEAHHTYDAAQANRCWAILSQVARVFEGSRCDFVGKCSPVHFFWGGFDLAVTRFSGRPAPPRDGPAFMREAYSHEVISHGFWFGSGPVLEPAFYAYAVPEPPGLKAARVQPRGAFYHGELGEFILPYETVRKADSPDQAIVAFVDSTYDQAAMLGRWNRAVLERAPG
ncbi:MAG TPA: DUF5996 family protein [Vicinamibacterales bacterium]|jgi:hypothetical protein|nr:DUF5996 family protein [Vicinamibacterales bacterium]